MVFATLLMGGGGLNILFADDTGSTVAGESTDDLKQKINGVLTASVQWIQANWLSLNIAKTKFMVYSCIYKEPIEFDKASVEGLNISIQRVSSIWYLGVKIDYNLSFKGHLGRLRIKAAQGVGIMYRLQHFFPYEILRLLYFFLVHSHLSFCPIVYLATFKTHLKPLQIVQNWALRILHKYLPSPLSCPGKTTTETLYLLVHILLISCYVTFLQCFLKLSMTIKYSQLIFSPLICLGERANIIIMRLGIKTNVLLLDL